MTNALVLSIDETAEALNRPRRTIYRMIDRGELKPVRFGGRQSIPIGQVRSLAGAL